MLGCNKLIYWIRECDTGYCLDDFTENFVEKQYYDELIKKIKYSELTKNTTLYFSKSSNFPRLKLENTGFKRCIKLDKADFVVINPKSLTDLTEWWYAVETDTTIYFGSYWTIYRHRAELEKFLGFTISSDMLTSIRGYELSEKRKDLLKLLQEPNIKFISDDELNRTINKSDQILDKETMMAVHDMLASSDLDTIELGLKMLTGFNIDETPLTISTLLLLNQRWWMTNARTNVLVQNMIKQLDISNKRVSSGFPYNISYLRSTAEKANEYDKELTKSLIFDKIVKYITANLSKDIEFFKLFNTDIKIEIK